MTVAVVLGGACGDGATPAAPADPGARLFSTKNCATCHGMQGEGTFLAPPLAGLTAHWTIDDLARFLAEPRVFVERDARLETLSQSFRSPMPPTFGTDAERRTLAEWLLRQR